MYCALRWGVVGGRGAQGPLRREISIRLRILRVVTARLGRVRRFPDTSPPRVGRLTGCLERMFTMSPPAFESLGWSLPGGRSPVLGSSAGLSPIAGQTALRSRFHSPRTVLLGSRHGPAPTGQQNCCCCPWHDDSLCQPRSGKTCSTRGGTMPLDRPCSTRVGRAAFQPANTTLAQNRGGFSPRSTKLLYSFFRGASHGIGRNKCRDLSPVVRVISSEVTKWQHKRDGWNSVVLAWPWAGRLLSPRHRAAMQTLARLRHCVGTKVATSRPTTDLSGLIRAGTDHPAHPKTAWCGRRYSSSGPGTAGSHAALDRLRLNPLPVRAQCGPAPLRESSDARGAADATWGQARRKSGCQAL
jgi:hypothetical protein